MFSTCIFQNIRLLCQKNFFIRYLSDIRNELHCSFFQNMDLTAPRRSCQFPENVEEHPLLQCINNIREHPSKATIIDSICGSVHPSVHLPLPVSFIDISQCRQSFYSITRLHLTVPIDSGRYSVPFLLRQLSVKKNGNFRKLPQKRKGPKKTAS